MGLAGNKKPPKQLTSHSLLHYILSQLHDFVPEPTIHSFCGFTTRFVLSGIFRACTHVLETMKWSDPCVFWTQRSNVRLKCPETA